MVADYFLSGILYFPMSLILKCHPLEKHQPLFEIKISPGECGTIYILVWVLEDEASSKPGEVSKLRR